MATALRQRAVFYQKLYTGMMAGMTLPQIIDAGLLPATSPARNAGIKAAIGKGKAVATVLLKAKLVSVWEAELIQVGESAGQLEAILSRLNEFYAAKLRQLLYVKGKLVAPGLTLLAALTVLPLPAIAAGSLPVGTYLLRTSLALAVLWFLYRKVLVGPLTSAAPAIANPLLHKLQGLVGNRHFFRQLFEIAYLDFLILCLASGLDAVQALTLLQGLSSSKSFRSRHAFVISAVQKNGTSLSEALAKHGILTNPEVLSFFQACEASGTLHSEMGVYVARKREELGATLDYWSRRISVLVYVMVTAYAAFRIVPLFLSIVLP